MRHARQFHLKWLRLHYFLTTRKAKGPREGILTPENTSGQVNDPPTCPRQSCCSVSQVNRVTPLLQGRVAAAVRLAQLAQGLLENPQSRCAGGSQDVLLDLSDVAFGFSKTYG